MTSLIARKAADDIWEILAPGYDPEKKRKVTERIDWYFKSLLKALEFYADEDNWGEVEDAASCQWPVLKDRDSGDVARAALAVQQQD